MASLLSEVSGSFLPLSPNSGCPEAVACAEAAIRHGWRMSNRSVPGSPAPAWRCCVRRPVHLRHATYLNNKARLAASARQRARPPQCDSACKNLQAVPGQAPRERLRSTVGRDSRPRSSGVGCVPLPLRHASVASGRKPIGVQIPASAPITYSHAWGLQGSAVWGLLWGRLGSADCAQVAVTPTCLPRRSRHSSEQRPRTCRPRRLAALGCLLANTDW